MTTTVSTIIKMIELLPEDKQEKIADYLRDYILELQDEMKWDSLFKNTEKELSHMAKEIKENTDKLENFDFDKL
ncbi:MAG: hypothetical protein Q9M37_06600 [Desulfonauticus sp.]|nr:hypothetical protein [Desulfonauticus sp.]